MRKRCYQLGVGQDLRERRTHLWSVIEYASYFIFNYLLRGTVAICVFFRLFDDHHRPGVRGQRVGRLKSLSNSYRPLPNCFHR